MNEIVETFERQQKLFRGIKIVPEYLRHIMRFQATNDVSGDLPILLPGAIVNISHEVLSISAKYLIDKDQKELRLMGSAMNGDSCTLEDIGPMYIDPPSLRKRVKKAFGGKIGVCNFIKLTIEDACQNEIEVTGMAIVDDSLGIQVRQK